MRFARRCAENASFRSTCSGATASRSGPRARPAGRLSPLCGQQQRIEGSAASECGWFPIGFKISRSTSTRPTHARPPPCADVQRVRPHVNGKPGAQVVKLDERARIELRRLGRSHRFVVWRVHDSRLSLLARGALFATLAMLVVTAHAAAGRQRPLPPAIQLGYFSHQDDRTRASVGAGIRARRGTLGSNRETGSSVSATSRHRRNGNPRTTLPAPYPPLKSSSAFAQNPEPLGPGSFWYTPSPGRACPYAPELSHALLHASRAGHTDRRPDSTCRRRSLIGCRSFSASIHDVAPGRRAHRCALVVLARSRANSRGAHGHARRRDRHRDGRAQHHRVAPG